ncbi:hypothetical protein [Citrobacter freundii]|uniref:hypothetical protein n=1 Tax=Citrobacter freundii TaxID=546 RepID=UPI001F14C02B|nr:hypothetical protein [Citrobacter freundii]MCO8026851.1 hypothetical protein [Citrobacter freundii]MCO8034837.1 hypothetical protein [Citrobacter freundii]MCO8040546.1 hypothetical protein [Citrobacter freundii]MDT7253881.1 hypothetical protein [Citrobacter freundii]
MTATNKPMTGAQLDELMAVAMRMQSDSEKMGERPVSLFAYAVQIAVLEIREVRSKYEELQSQNADMAVQLANAESKCRELAAENAGLKNPENWLSQSDYGYEASEVATQNGATEDESLRAGMIAIINRIGTPATDAFLAEVRASAIPEGYVLVPQQIFLDPSDIESICSQCGDGHESGYGDFTDGLLWVGNIQRDDGSIVHGLHISSADYTEEGGVTVYEFAAQLRKGAAL